MKPVEEGKPSVTTAYLYDLAGNRLKMETVTDGEKLTVNYTYDEAGRLVKLWDSENGETLYTYDKAGNLIKEEGSEERHYLYDACGRLTAVTDKENLLLAALYDGNDNRVFTMEYTPELSADRKRLPKPDEDTEDERKEDETGNRTEEGEDEEPGDFSYEEWSQGAGNAAENLSGTNPGENGTGSVHGAEKTGSAGLLSEQEIDPTEKENGLSGDLEEDLLENGEESSPADGQAEGRENAGLSDAEAVNESDKEGAKAFWYGVLCQAADIFLPAPTPFKAWLHDRMGFRDDVTVLWESRLWEADLGKNVQTVEEAESPFELIEGIFGDENRTAFSVRAYRQVSYVNDITFPNAQVLSEYAVNGIMGESLTGYSYGLWRESFRVTIGNGITGTISAGAASVDGAGIKNTGTVRGSVMTGNYYYTGTGSVANLIWGDGTTGYVYGTNGSRSVYGAESAVLYTRTQAAGYGYNGEYTHEGLGMQYLRARYLNMVTGTFLSRDTYGGAMDNILSQNRYTYVGNNPVNYADPDGHKAVGSTIKNTFSAIADAARNGARNAQNQTGRAAEIATAKAGDGAAAVSMATNRITKNEVNGVSQGTTKGGTAVQSAGERIIQESPNEQSWLEKAWNTVEKGKNAVAVTIDYGIGEPWIENAAAQAEQQICSAYDYCQNKLQETVLAGSQFMVITDIFNKNDTNVYPKSPLQGPALWFAYYIVDINRQYRESLTEEPNYDELENLPDYTDAIQSRMDQTVQEYRNYMAEHGYAATMYKFYNDVKTGGALDIKDPENWKKFFENEGIDGSTPFIFRGQKMDKGMLGNETYGYLGTSLGVPAPVLYLGGGWAHMKNVTESNLHAFTCIVMPDYGDAPEDHETVRGGINWYHEMNRMRREKNEK